MSTVGSKSGFIVGFDWLLADASKLVGKKTVNGNPEPARLVVPVQLQQKGHHLFNAIAHNADLAVPY